VRRLAALRWAPEWERAGLRPPARPGAQVRAEEKARVPGRPAQELAAPEPARERRALGLAKRGDVTFVWLPAVRKTAAIVTRTTPPSKAHNQRDMAIPFARSELSPMMGNPHPSVESIG